MKLFADMHVHSKFSVDGTSTMEEYCLAAEKTGSRIICFTEHVDFNSMEKNLSIIKDNRTQNFVVDDYFCEINRLRKRCFFAGGEIKKMKNVLSPSSYSCETNEDATKQIIDLFGFTAFDTPKKYSSLTLLSGIEFSEPHLFPHEFAKYCAYPFDCITAGMKYSRHSVLH